MQFYIDHDAICLCTFFFSIYIYNITKLNNVREKEKGTQIVASLQSHFPSLLQKGARGCVDGCV